MIKFLRKSVIHKVLVWFFLMLIIESTFLSADVLALTTGPHMPEYISYEGPGAPDLVNLATGDLSLSLPVIEVPGPEGGFSLPLSYHAGIGLDQQSSWVGLGWSMNPGAITRTINGFPDDANGEGQSVTVKDLEGLRGWHNQVLGVGTFGWNNQQGEYGNLSILNIVNAGWGNGNDTYVGILGFNVGDNRMNFDGVQFTMGVMTIATWGVGAAASGSVTFVTVAKEAAVSAVTNVVLSAGMSLANPQRTNAPSDGYWKYQKKEKKNWGIAVLSGANVFLKEYKVWLDRTRYEKMYGLMYLGNAETTPYTNDGNGADLSQKVRGSSTPLRKFAFSTQTLNEGAASDIIYENDNSLQYHEVNNPFILAPDNFIVRVAGIAGNISPYRLDVGTAAMPREMTSKHVRLAPIPFLPNDNNYKTPFVYKGQLSNSYYHHLGGVNSIGTPSTVNFGVTHGYASNTLTYDFTDVVFDLERIKGSISSRKKLAQAQHVEWLSNKEIRESSTYSSKFIDFLDNTRPNSSTPSPREVFRSKIALTATSTCYTTALDATVIPWCSSTPVSVLIGKKVNICVSSYGDQNGGSSGTTSVYRQYTGVTVQAVNTTNNSFSVNASEIYEMHGSPANVEVSISSAVPSADGMGNDTSLGGFCITASDGATYHFAIPVYDRAQISEIREVAYPDTKKSIIRRSTPFANTWLLTAVTGSDYIDRNANGLVDDQDWGYWVKLNYGWQTNEYAWRIPYSGYTKAPSGIHESYSGGTKQLIYLNSIETRSHVALFLKSPRLDGKDAKLSDNIFPLKLDEVVLLRKETYRKIVQDYGISPYSNKINLLCLSSHFNGALRSFINMNCEKRLLFFYDYTLCAQTLNSTAGGKLTLKSISLRGRNDHKIIPDYKFEYAYNPDYNIDCWDAWGFYNRKAGRRNVEQLNEAIANIDAAAWSLTKVINPLGSEIFINYERDTYSSVSGAPPLEGAITFNNDSSNPHYTLPSADDVYRKFRVQHAGTLKVGDHLSINGSMTYDCSSSATYSTPFSADFCTVTAVEDDIITLDQSVFHMPECVGNETRYIQSGYLRRHYAAKKGDGIRVSAIMIRDEFGNENKIRYLYNYSDGFSSGVIAQEPDYISNQKARIGYPETPVIYGEVTVLSGKHQSVNDFHTKQVYQFITPSTTQYLVSSTAIVNGFERPSGVYIDRLYMYNHKIEDFTAKIGALSSVKTFNKSGQLSSKTDLEYTPILLNDGVNNYQGVYTSGALMTDRLNVGLLKIHKVNRTTQIDYPFALSKVVNTKDGISSQSQNMSWDLYSGRVNQSIQKNALGLFFKSVIQPAYREYPEMGPRALNPSNKHMLSQDAAVYIYRTDATGNELGLVSANVQTWRNSWSNYRYLDTYGNYVSAPEEIQSSSNRVWRKSKDYIWVGQYSRLNVDGTHKFTSGDKFDFRTTPGTNWRLMGEPTLFDHYGMPLEVFDVDHNMYAAVKMGYDDRHPIAEATNATYSEIAFSSAEDFIAGTNYFGGEVSKGTSNSTIVSKSQGYDTHTGEYALSVTNGGNGFVYKTTGVVPKKTYRASVWCKSTSGRLYYKLNGVETSSLSPTIQGKQGWYLINLEFSIPAGTTITSFEVGTKTISGTILFDDFRFQPKDASMQCSVIPALGATYNTTGIASSYWSLDNNNFYTRFEVSEDGHCKKVFKESAMYGGEKLVSEDTETFRRTTINP